MFKMSEVAVVILGAGAKRAVISLFQLMEQLEYARSGEMVELLPPGFWPLFTKRQGDNADDRNCVIKISVSQIEDWGRLDFLKRLATEKNLRIVKFFPSAGKSSYYAFIIKAKSGRKLALLDTPEANNALYVFDAKDDNWLELAQLTKWEVIQHGYPFLKRIFHLGAWQERVTNLLDTM
jgi:hypothetical protein